MVHVFRACGALMALDVDSGAVHQLDELAFDALSLLNALPREQAYDSLCAKYPPAEVDEVLSEIEELRGQGAMHSENDYAGLEMPHQGVLKAMCLNITHDCDLRCRYCFAGTGGYHGPRGLMSAEVGKKALDFLVAHSAGRRQLEVDFFGGEPLLNFEAVKQIVEHGRALEKAHGKVFHFTMTTNGTGLTEEVIGYLNREMYNVVLSIDGRREVHDRMRPMAGGGGSYDMVIEKARELVRRRENGQYYVRGTYTAENLDFSEDVLALADAGFDQISIEPVVLPESSKYALTEKMLPRIYEEYERLAAQMLARRREGKGFQFFHFTVDLTGGPCIRKRLTGCGAGSEYIAVTPEGDIYPCHQFVGREGYKMGSVLEGTLSRDMQLAFAGNHVLAKETCGACWAKYFCSGGCAANAQAFMGDISKPYPMECALEKKRLECAIALFALIKNSGN